MEIALYIIGILGLAFHQAWKIRHRQSKLRPLSANKWIKENWFNVGLGLTVTIVLIATSIDQTLKIGPVEFDPTYFNSFILGWFSDSIFKKVGKETGLCPK